MKIIFMGTPYFAVPSLEILYNAGYDIVGVITSPDKYGGRGRKTLIESDVKQFAKDKNLKILQPTNLKSKQFNAELKALNADIQIVVAFRMLPEMVWNMPSLGTYNLHGSLLPQYRGAAPINWAIINGETETGVTCFKLKHAIDTGSLLLQDKVKIYPTDTAGDLHDRMMYIGADTVLSSVRLIESGKANLKEQDETIVSHAPKLHKYNTEIDFTQGAQKVYNFIRGLSPYPRAWLLIDGLHTKVNLASYEISNHSDIPGKIITDNKTMIKVVTPDGYINLLELQISGKRSMKTKELLNGFKPKEAIVVEREV